MGQPAPISGRLDVVVTELAPDVSRSRAASLIREGCVQVDGAVVTRPAAKVFAGALVQVVVPEPVPDEAVPQDLPLRVVHEDADLVVVDKDPGVVVHPAAGHADGTLVNALLHHVGDLSGVGGVQRPGIVHRLDKGTSGLLVVAKHDVAHRSLAEQFAVHTARRTYLAICFGELKEAQGTIVSHLERHPKDRMRFASSSDGRGRRAVTHWRQVATGRGLSLIRCELETGRTHQIRVHLTEQGLPLVGDPLYKARSARMPPWLAPLVPAERVMLHAWQLVLTHPADGTPQHFLAAVPEDMVVVLHAAGMQVPEP